jgi:hypothetical protein
MVLALTRTSRTETQPGGGKHPDKALLLSMVSYPDYRETAELLRAELRVQHRRAESVTLGQRSRAVNAFLPTGTDIF